MYILDIYLVKLYILFSILYFFSYIYIFGASLLLTCYMTANLLAITCFKGVRFQSS